MKKYLIGSSLLLSSLITPTFAEESKSFYLSVGGGITFPSDSKTDTILGNTTYDVRFENDNSGLFSVGIGKKFSDYRIEFNHLRATVKSNSFSVTNAGTGVTASITPNLKADYKSFMIYGYKDFPTETKFTPYAGVGLGLGSFSGENQVATVNGTTYQLKGADEAVFSFGLKGGASYEIVENTSIYSELMYQNFAPYRADQEGFETVKGDATNIFAVTAGLKFNF